jgi:hypothetical protein
MHVKGAAVAVALAIVSGATGCGSSGPLTAAQLSQKATAICKQRMARVATIRRQHPGDFAGLNRAAAPVMTKSVGDLTKLKPSASQQATYARFVAIEQIYLREFNAQIAGRRGSGGTTPDRTHEMERITETLDIKACQ